MGNDGSKNDDFSKNPNFNMQQHNQAMQRLGGNYAPVNLNVPQHSIYQPKTESTHLTEVLRESYLYVPSISVVVKGGCRAVPAMDGPFPSSMIASLAAV